MDVEDLGRYCSSINIDCDFCNHRKECEKFNDLIDELSPCGFMNLALNMEKYKVD